ncbi:MAG: alkaline phosphatase family protein [Coxiellaceae bacterium]|nr:alkaline phosphatase family protein [Coxiellaceae bacterium]
MNQLRYIILTLLVTTLTPLYAASANTNKAAKKNVILFIWDGLRPDSINRKDTPNLYRLKQQGSYFSKNHSSYPTLTMINAASFATGDLAGKTGFYGNVIWDPTAKGTNDAGKKVDFQRPVFTEDYHILADLNSTEAKGPLLEVKHLFQALHKNGINTATVGKSGPADLQDYQQQAGKQGIVFDEQHVYPLTFAHWLQQKNYPLPLHAPFAFKKDVLTLKKNNGNPTGFGRFVDLKDDVTTDPAATSKSPFDRANRFLMKTYLQQIIPYSNPHMSVVWLRNPDTTEHAYGVGSRSYYTSIHSQDRLLGKLIRRLKKNGSWKNTDLIVASDHAHSNVSGPQATYPLRAIKQGEVTHIDQHGYSVSGSFRPADLLHRAGFKAFDGSGCQYSPVLTGIKADGSAVYPTKIDKDGSVCHHNIQLKDTYADRTHKLKGQRYTTGNLRIPTPLPKNAVIVASNGGSTYFYVPSHNPALIKKLVRFIQSREEFGPIFVHIKHGDVPGTIELTTVGLLNDDHKNPDIIASSHYDNSAYVKGFTGTEFNSSGINRGMHGSFSHTDVHNTLIAYGPDFKKHFIDPLPSANVDVPNTIAHLFGMSLVNTNGRVLSEALKQGAPLSSYQLHYKTIKPQTVAKHIDFKKTTNPDGKDIDKGKSTFTEQLNLSLLKHGKKTTMYFDSAKERRY